MCEGRGTAGGWTSQTKTQRPKSRFAPSWNTITRFWRMAPSLPLHWVQAPETGSLVVIFHGLFVEVRCYWIWIVCFLLTFPVVPIPHISLFTPSTLFKSTNGQDGTYHWFHTPFHKHVADSHVLCCKYHTFLFNIIIISSGYYCIHCVLLSPFLFIKFKRLCWVYLKFHKQSINVWPP